MPDTISLAAGEMAPAFTLPAIGERATVSLSDYHGQLLVLYFYPKDATPGCTSQASDFSAQTGAFAAIGAHILGISKDTLKSHEAFAAKQGLAFPLASDAETNVCEAYGVWKEKSMYGKKFMGIERTTFLIGSDGRILSIWPRVKVPGHADDVLRTVRTFAD